MSASSVPSAWADQVDERPPLDDLGQAEESARTEVHRRDSTVGIECEHGRRHGLEHRLEAIALDGERAQRTVEIAGDLLERDELPSRQRHGCAREHDHTRDAGDADERRGDDQSPSHCDGSAIAERSELAISPERERDVDEDHEAEDCEKRARTEAHAGHSTASGAVRKR
jgi:hypothetical protein